MEKSETWIEMPNGTQYRVDKEDIENRTDISYEELMIIAKEIRYFKK